jgi:hypothetical protein
MHKWGQVCELADYHDIHGHCNVPAKVQRKTKLITVGHQRRITICTRKDIADDHLQNSGIGELRFLMGPKRRPMEATFEQSLLSFAKSTSTATFQLSTAKTTPIGKLG